MTQSAVLVVGAGPVGLSTALALARQGTPVRIVDSNSGPTALSKAIVIWRRSLLTLDPYLPIDQLLRLGIEARGARFFDQGRSVAALPFSGHGHGLPAGLLLPQSRLEKVLIQALAEAGITVERHTLLKSFTQSAEGVQCVMERTTGTETWNVPFLIGCDGAHSQVRHTLGLDFAGESVAQRWLLGDIDIDVVDGINPRAAADAREADIEPGWIYIDSSSNGALALFPIEPGRYRLIVDGGPADPAVPRCDPTLEELQAALHQRTRLQWRALRAHWLADFRVNERQVAQYVQGRVRLAGDAAHVHSPAGGQGMNTGIQDALNLAWKVSLVHSGEAGPELLQTYHQERHPVAARVIRMSGRMLRAGMVTNAVARHLRDLVMSVALHVPAVRELATDALSEDDIHYHHSDLVEAAVGSPLAASGHAFPEAQVELNGQLRPATDLLRGEPGTMGTLILEATARAENWPSHFGHRPLAIRHLGPNLRDVSGKLQAILHLDSGEGLLVRPDGIIATRGTAADAHRWLRRHFRSASPAAA